MKGWAWSSDEFFCIVLEVAHYHHRKIIEVYDSSSTAKDWKIYAIRSACLLYVFGGAIQSEGKNMKKHVGAF